MRVRPEPSPQHRTLHKVVSMRQHSLPREGSPVDPARMARTIKLRQKSRTETNDNDSIGKMHAFMTGVPMQSPSHEKTNRQRLNSLNRFRPQPNRESHVLLQRAKSLYRQSQMDDAIALFQRLLKQQPKPQLLFYLGSAFLNKQDHQTARHYLQQLLHQSPTFSKQAYLLLSIAYRKLRLFVKAKQVLLRSLQQLGQFEQAHQYLGKLHMKMKEFEQAVVEFRLCLELRPESGLSEIGLADALRSQGHLQQAVCHYSKALAQESRYQLVCLLKRMTAYFQLQRYSEAELDADELLLNKVASSEVHYFKGMLLLNRGEAQSATVYFEEALRLNNVPQAVTRSLQELVKIHIKIKDFYQAAFHIARSSHLNVNKQYLQNLFMFVEGVVDSIKKRYKESLEKLEKVERSLKEGSCAYGALLLESIHLYLAYSYFCTQQYDMALSHYNLIEPPQCHTPSLMYNKLLCEGIIKHQHKKYSQASSKLQQAKKHMPNRVQPYFYKAVNYMQQHYSGSARAYLPEKAIKQLSSGQKINSNNSLFYFYSAVLLATRQKPQLYLILKAIDKSEDNIAQYYFVKAIIYSQNGNYQEALADFSNALVIDPDGLDFLKERSKCLYMLGRHEQAVADIKRCIEKCANDYQAKLLHCFYLYAIESDEEALGLLMATMENDTSSSPKIATFVSTLHFRVGNYQQAGVVGTVMLNLQSGQQPTAEILKTMDLHISTKELLGQFHTGHLLCLRGAVHLYAKQYSECGRCLQNAMTEIKDSLQLDSDQASIDSESELRIYQVKFNMILLTLCQKDYGKAEILLKMLIDDTEMTILVDQLTAMMQLLKQSQMEPPEPQREQSFFLFDGRINLLSQKFQPLRIVLPNLSVLVSRPVLFFPERLNFSITPELSDDMLRCFGMDKIQDRPEPPWVMRGQQHIFFTDNVEMRRSVCVNSTMEQAHPDATDRLKLDQAIQAKLNRIIHGS